MEIPIGSGRASTLAGGFIPGKAGGGGDVEGIHTCPHRDPDSIHGEPEHLLGEAPSFTAEEECNPPRRSACHNGVPSRWLISLIVNGAICVGLLLRQRWSFLAAPGWLLINAVLSIKAVLANDLSAEQTSEYLVVITVLTVFGVLALCLKRFLFPYYALRGPKVDDGGNLLILRQAGDGKSQ